MIRCYFRDRSNRSDAVGMNYSFPHPDATLEEFSQSVEKHLKVRQRHVSTGSLLCSFVLLDPSAGVRCARIARSSLHFRRFQSRWKGDLGGRGEERSHLSRLSFRSVCPKVEVFGRWFNWTNSSFNLPRLRKVIHLGSSAAVPNSSPWRRSLIPICHSTSNIVRSISPDQKFSFTSSVPSF